MGIYKYNLKSGRFGIILLLLVVVIGCSNESEFKPVNIDQKYPVINKFDRDGDEFLTIAHRGASAYYPENTMAAFRGALKMEADMMELDVLLSKDQEVVVIHDNTLKRTTNGKGRVADKTFEELQKLDAGSWFKQKFSDERIPHLREVLELAKDSIAVNIEIKTEAVTDRAEGGIEEKALQLVRELGMEDQVIFSSFDYRALQHLRQLDPNIPTAVLYNKQESPDAGPAQLADSLQANVFNCSYRQLSMEWMNDASRDTLPVMVYTVNRQLRMETLIKRGVKGIFSNKPDLLKKSAQRLSKRTVK